MCASSENQRLTKEGRLQEGMATLGLEQAGEHSDEERKQIEAIGRRAVPKRRLNVAFEFSSGYELQIRRRFRGKGM